MRIDALIAGFLERTGLAGRPALVGFSGGADSTALLLALHGCNLPVQAVHFHHGLRGAEADADAAWCRRFCGERGIPFEEIRLEVPAHRMRGESCEACGRRLRLGQWESLAKGGLPVFLAHHQDDCLEDFFLRLARGANVSSLLPTKEDRVIRGIRFLRPLLTVRRREIEAYLLAHGVGDWRVDSTNSENGFRRNAVRNRLLPLFRELFGTDAGLLQAMTALRQDAAFLDDEARRAYESGLCGVDAWLALPPALFVRCLRLKLTARFPDSQLTHTVVSQLRRELESFSRSQRAIACGGHWIYVTAQGLSLEPEPWEDCAWEWRRGPLRIGSWTFRAIEAETELSEADGFLHEAFDAQALPDTLTVRHWREGDRMIPFGSTNARRLKELFSDVKLPRYLRHDCPLLEADGTIVWVPGVRRARFGAVGAGSPRVVLAARRDG